MLTLGYLFRSKIVNKAEQITDVLSNVRRLAETESIKSSLNIDLLEESTSNLRTLHSNYSGQNVLLKSSKALIRHMELADKKDRYAMMASFGVLGLVLAWIVWRRVLKAPVMVLLGVGRVVVKVGKVVNKVNPAAGKGTSTVGDVVSSTVLEAVSVITELVSSVSTEVAGSSTTTTTQLPSSTTQLTSLSTDLATQLAGTIMKGVSDYLSDYHSNSNNDNILTVLTRDGVVETVYKTIADEL